MDPWTDTKNDKSSDAYALLGKDKKVADYVVMNYTTLVIHVQQAPINTGTASPKTNNN